MESGEPQQNAEILAADWDMPDLGSWGRTPSTRISRGPLDRTPSRTLCRCYKTENYLLPDRAAAMVGESVESRDIHSMLAGCVVISPCCFSMAPRSDNPAAPCRHESRAGRRPRAIAYRLAERFGALVLHRQHCRPDGARHRGGARHRRGVHQHTASLPCSDGRFTRRELGRRRLVPAPRDTVPGRKMALTPLDPDRAREIWSDHTVSAQ
jgi:hypothetical protein